LSVPPAGNPGRTSRLAFEALTTAHAAELAPLLADPRLWRWIPRLPPAPADVARRFAAIARVDRPNGDRWLNWVIRRGDDRQAIGMVETTVRPDGRAYLAYFVFVPFQGRGYAREACAAALVHLRSRCGVTSVEAEVDTRNEPSQRLLASLGFIRATEPYVADPIGGEPALDYRYKLESFGA
jgi:ribosomal-protein-alanine N-acetyltransferase